MIFTPEEIQSLFNIIDYRVACVITDVLGKEFLMPKDLEALKEFDFDFTQELQNISPYYQSFIFGKLAGVLAPEQLKTLNYTDITKYVKEEQYKALTKREKLEYNAAATRSYGYIKGMGNRFKESLSNSISEEELRSSIKEREIETLSVIKQEIERGVLERRTVQSIASTLGNRLDDWNRDWGRIVETEMHSIYCIGQAQTIMENHGTEALVYKQVFSGACTHCRRLYTTAGSGSKPRIFKLSDLINNGDNIGRKAKDWKPVVEAIHPYCRCSLRYLPKGFVWDEDKHSFEPQKNYERKVERKSKVRIMVGTKVFEV